MRTFSHLHYIYSWFVVTSLKVLTTDYFQEIFASLEIFGEGAIIKCSPACFLILHSENLSAAIAHNFTALAQMTWERWRLYNFKDVVSKLPISNSFCASNYI